MFSNQLILMTFTLFYVDPVNEAFDNICKVIEFIPGGDTACKIGALINKSNYLHVVPAGQCKEIGVEQYGITEICSTPPFQLYFKASNYDVNGCYHMGEVNKDYMQCCQFRHAWSFMAPNSPYAYNAVAQVHIGTFCSGTDNGDKSFKSVPNHGLPFNLNNNTDTLLYYQTKVTTEVCSENISSLECEHAKEDLKLILENDHEVNWHTVKRV
ncbi:hypothetical protein PIROE2DRAFT_9655 [Piromyces sp. E2]|nr:hypothetical protein PIROE2DRAFT_9655 [Piromyces sp. E2]|eukprot:OUM63718.1 hypothetical protein PIROE2DRAFT_9655 [Piromyces sp. E2]